MLTPRFSLKQTETTLTITIRAPFCHLDDLEVVTEGDTFLFTCKPYYLRLELPGHVVEDSSKGSLNVDKHEFEYTYDKLHPGVHFEDLDLITKFLVEKVTVSQDITILTSEGPQDEFEASSEGFGFALQGSTKFLAVSSEFEDVFDVSPKETLQKRKELRIQFEQNKFDKGHYVADFLENDEILEIVNLERKRLPEHFTEEELDLLKDLPNKKYNLNEQQIKIAFNCLLDVLFALCYEKRTNCFDEEHSPEAGWTVNKLAASLAWLDCFDTAKETLITCFRRSLIMPLYRHFLLAQKVFEDLKEIVKGDEKVVVKNLLEIYRIFSKVDGSRFILNNLFIKDCIIYVMKWDKIAWKSFVEEVFLIEIKKEDLGLNLLDIEEGCDLTKCFESLTVDSDDEEESSSSTSEESD